MTVDWPGKRFPLVAINRVVDIQLGKMLQPIRASLADVPTPYLRAGSLSQLGSDHYPEMFASPLDRQRYGVREGDLLIAEGGDAGRAEFAKTVPPGAIIQNSLHRVRSSKADIRFVKYCLDAVYASGWLEVYCSKSTFGHLTREKLAALRIPVPPPARQRAVSDYLDAETERIDALVDARGRMLRLLDERLDGVVTRTLDRPDWTSVPLKWKTRVTVGIVVRPADLYADTGVPCLRGFNVQPGVITDEDLVYISPEANAANAKSELREGDVVVVRTGNAGAASVVPGWAVGGNCVDVLIARRAGTIDPRFLEAVLNSAVVRRQIEEKSVGALQAHFNTESLAALRIPTPDRDQQAMALAAIDAARAGADAMRTALARQINLLTERRHAVITAAVTGQLEIPRVAA